MEKLIEVACDKRFKNMKVSEDKKVYCSKTIESGNIKAITAQVEKITKDEKIQLDDIFISYGDGYTLEASYEKMKKRTETEMKEAERKNFAVNIFRYIYQELTAAGYKRIPFDITELIKRGLDNIDLYDLYMSKDFKRLADYYSLYFKLEGGEK